MISIGPADATATPSSLAPVKSIVVLPVWYWLNRLSLEKRPLSVCCGNLQCLVGVTLSKVGNEWYH